MSAVRVSLALAGLKLLEHVLNVSEPGPHAVGCYHRIEELEESLQDCMALASVVCNASHVHEPHCLDAAPGWARRVGTRVVFFDDHFGRVVGAPVLPCSPLCAEARSPRRGPP